MLAATEWCIRDAAKLVMAWNCSRAWKSVTYPVLLAPKSLEVAPGGLIHGICEVSSWLDQAPNPRHTCIAQICSRLVILSCSASHTLVGRVAYSLSSNRIHLHTPAVAKAVGELKDGED